MRVWTLVALFTCGACSSGGSVVFLSSVQYNGNLDGLDGADAKCTTLAQGAKLDGSWKAWLSNSKMNAADRIADVSPWSLPDGTLVFNNKVNLSTTPVNPIDMDEHGAVTIPMGQVNNLQAVWTGTLVSGTKATATCSDWTTAADTSMGLVGNAQLNSAGWTDSPLASSTDTQACSNKFYLYCLQQ